jgi:predicted DNA-binding transcriptional regulator AlpA
MSKTNLDEIRLLNRRQVAEAVNCSPNTLDGWVGKKLFPSPLQARPGGPKQWRLSTVKAWIEKRCRARYVPPTPRGQLKHGNKLGGER